MGNSHLHEGCASRAIPKGNYEFTWDGALVSKGLRVWIKPDWSFAVNGDLYYEEQEVCQQVDD